MWYSVQEEKIFINVESLRVTLFKTLRRGTRDKRIRGEIRTTVLLKLEILINSFLWLYKLTYKQLYSDFSFFITKYYGRPLYIFCFILFLMSKDTSVLHNNKGHRFVNSSSSQESHKCR